MISIKYHRIFDYELIKSDFPKWRYKTGSKDFSKISTKKNALRLQREKYSQEKLKIANKASSILAKIPTVKFVGITGSLAMMNADKTSDIDLMIIVQKNSLWTTRLITLICLIGQIRRAGERNQKDRLCLNIWLDETDLIWDKKDRNIYTAHEIAQIVPLVNKEKTYEKFLWENKWILDFWPNSVEYKPLEKKLLANYYSLITSIFEKIAFNLQKIYMSNKITRETITPTRALFHPQDWGKVVLEKLNSTP